MTATPNLGLPEDDSISHPATTWGAPAPVFRARPCQSLLQARVARSFEEDEVLYEVGDTARVVFFIRKGIVKTGTATGLGREIIYHLRKDGEVVGELCLLDTVRRERAVAIEKTEAVLVDLDEIVTPLARQPPMLGDVLTALCRGLAEAHDQVNRMADNSVSQGLTKVLRDLALKLGQPSGKLVEITTYLTQEELSQMVGARRERVSTVLNALRRRGLVQYTVRGHLLLDVGSLEER
jgi:CRP/FNR family transcriptional regulator